MFVLNIADGLRGKEMQDYIQDDSYLMYKLVVHQAQLQRPTGYSSSHSFAETQELMGATKTPPIKKLSSSWHP